MKNEITNLIKSKDLNELTIEMIESIIDNHTVDEMIKEVPIIKSIVVIKNLWTSFSDRIFIKKALRTLLELKDVNWKDRIDFITELKEKGVSGSEKLLMIIDKLDTIEKSEIFGKLCRLRALKKIKRFEFLTLSNLIQNAFLPYLRLHTYFYEYTSNDSITIKKIDPNPLLLMGIIEKKPYTHTELRDSKERDFEYRDEIIKYKYIYSRLGLLLAEHSHYLLGVGVIKTKPNNL